MNYEEMSPEELILHFRNAYEEVYLTTVNDVDYIWRTLTQKEHKEIAEFATDNYDAYERICQTAILYPEYDYMDGGLAYLPETIAPHILNESGYGAYRKEQPLLTIFRNQVSSDFLMQATILINRAFSYITLDEMENWTKEKILKYVAKAEWSLRFIDQKKHIELLTEEEIRQSAEENGEEIPEEEPFDLMKVANDLRKQGQDPMFVLRHLYQKEKKPYFERPMIGGAEQTDTMISGVDAWKQEGQPYGRFDTVREQVQALSRR